MGTDIRTIKDRLEVKEEMYADKERLSLPEDGWMERKNLNSAAGYKSLCDKKWIKG